MKKVYEGRILGFGFVSFVVGVLGFAKFGIDIIWLAVPFAMLWFFNYEFASYEVKHGHQEAEKIEK